MSDFLAEFTTTLVSRLGNDWMLSEPNEFCSLSRAMSFRTSSFRHAAPGHVHLTYLCVTAKSYCVNGENLIAGNKIFIITRLIALDYDELAHRFYSNLVPRVLGLSRVEPDFRNEFVDRLRESVGTTHDHPSFPQAKIGFQHYITIHPDSITVNISQLSPDDAILILESVQEIANRKDRDNGNILPERH